jgi:hypothetical protein
MPYLSMPCIWSARRVGGLRPSSTLPYVPYALWLPFTNSSDFGIHHFCSDEPKHELKSSPSAADAALTPGATSVQEMKSFSLPGLSEMSPSHRGLGLSEMSPSHRGLVPGLSEMSPSHRGLVPGLSDMSPSHRGLASTSSSLSALDQFYHSHLPTPGPFDARQNAGEFAEPDAEGCGKRWPWAALENLGTRRTMCVGNLQLTSEEREK